MTYLSNCLFGLFLIIASTTNLIAQDISCFNGYYLCSTNEVFVDELGTIGTTPSACMNGLEYFGSVTFYVSPQTDREVLTFDLFPSYKLDDIDFQVIKISPNGMECKQWEVIRCNASGPQLSKEKILGNCFGSTGLIESSIDKIESRGCDIDNDGYLSAVHMEKGNIYAIKAFNSTSNKGFSLKLSDDIKLLSSLPESPIGDLLRPLVTTSNAPNICFEFNPPYESNAVLLYPNPTYDIIFIHSLEKRMISYTVTNTAGSNIYSADANNHHVEKINVSAFPQGLYHIQINTEDGNSVVKPFVKTQ